MTVNTNIQITPLAPTYGAEISGVDWSRPLDNSTFNAVKEAMDKYGVIILRETNFEDESLIEFGRRFGTLDTVTAHISARYPARLPLAEIFDVGNLTPKNEISDESEPEKVAIANANMQWHSDGQYNPLRTSWSMLRAVEIPPAGTGGETEFLDARAAYDDLSQPMKERIEGLVGLNNMHNRVKLANPDMEKYKNMIPADHPSAKHKICCVHEATGRRVVYVSAYTHHIENMPDKEGEELIQELFDHLRQDKYKLVGSWKSPGDVIIWDNTAVLHRATGGTFRGKYRRDMRRISVLDNGPEAYGLNSPGDLWRQGAP